MFQMIVNLAGVTYRDAQENIKRFGCKDIGSFALVREPENAHDPNAIRVEVAGFFLGYIPSKIARTLAPLMDAGREFLALFVRRNQSPYHETVGLMIKIVEVTDDKKSPGLPVDLMEAISQAESGSRDPISKECQR